MRPWLPLPASRLEALDQQALASVNAVIQQFGGTPLDALARLFDVAEETLLGFPELDHYAERGPARYWGNLPDAGIGIAPAWPALPGKRMFAYLRAHTRHHAAGLAALRELGQPAIICFPDAPAGLIERYAAAHLVYSAAPLDLARTAREADAGLTYSSMSTTVRFLMLGKPLMLLPGHLEQYLLARRVEEMGAGLLINPEQPATDLLIKLRRVLFEPQFSQSAQAFARKYAAFAQETVVAHMARRIEELAAARVVTLSFLGSRLPPDQ